jgi:hypothetical protein
MSEKPNIALVVGLVWIVLAAGMILTAVRGGPLALTADNAMQLAQTRDLLAGQSWFDTTQWRMNAPYGLPMHWSHLLDAALAAIILLLRCFAAPKTAEIWALYAWPVLLLLFSLLAIARMGERFAGRVGALFALLLAASCSAAGAAFRPGNIDHHNLQITLTLWMMAFLVDFSRAKWVPVATASIACLSLAIGMETLPYVVVAIAAVGLYWVWDGDEIAGRIRQFGAAFAVAGVVLLGGATASAYRFVATCDTYSGFYAAIALSGGLGLAAITAVPVLKSSRGRRMLSFLGLAATLAGLAAFLNPVCLKGPYGALDPRLVPIWFSRVWEVQSPFALAHEDPGYFVTAYCYAVLAALASVLAIFVVARDMRRAAVSIAAIALCALAITSIEVRGMPFAMMYALPGLAAFVVAGIERLRLSKTLGAATLIASLLASSDASFAAVGNAIQKSLPSNRQFDRVQYSWMQQCLSPEALGQLASLPQGRVLGFLDQGPSILIYTHHAAVGGDYHRDVSGILDTYGAFTGSVSRSAAIIASRGIDYVMICRTAPDYRFYRGHDGGQGILSLLAKSHEIAWLERTGYSSGEIEIYRVVRPQLH